MTSTKTDVWSSFAHEKLTPIIGKPDYPKLRNLQRELYANARTIESELGGGAHGHLALLLPDATYLTLAGQAYDAPTHPGPLPNHANGATAAQITEANRRHDHAVAQFQLHTAVSNALRQQMIAAVDPLYIQDLADPLLGHIGTPRAMLQHLLTNYGKLTDTDIKNNRDELSALWSPDDPIEQLWDRITTVQAIADHAGDPITNRTAMSEVLLVIKATKLFNTAVHDWRNKADADKTLTNFKLHFNEANTERLEDLTAEGAGFHGANAAATTPPTNPPPTNAGAIVTNNMVMMFYCFTHGLGMNPDHTSATCRNKCEGHIDTATADNMQGGCNLIYGNRPRRSNAGE